MIKAEEIRKMAREYATGRHGIESSGWSYAVSGFEVGFAAALAAARAHLRGYDFDLSDAIKEADGLATGSKRRTQP